MFAPVKKWTFLLMICCLSAYSSAQQVPQYSQFLQNQYMVNPASTGASNSLRERKIKWILSNDDIDENDSVLDIGCGNGVFLLELAAFRVLVSV